MYVGQLSEFTSSEYGSTWEPGTGALNIFNRLGARGFEGIRSSFAGTLLGLSNDSGVSTSGAGYVGETIGSKTSASTETQLITPDLVAPKTMDDLYSIMHDVMNAVIDLPNQPFGTITRIAEAGNTVKIGNDLTYLQDILTMTAMNVQNIYSLLAAKFSGAEEANLVDVAAMPWSHPFDWAQTAVGGGNT